MCRHWNHLQRILCSALYSNTVNPRYEPDERGWRRTHNGLPTWFSLLYRMATSCLTLSFPLARCPVLSLSSAGFQEMVGIVAELSTGGKNGLITGIYCTYKKSSTAWGTEHLSTRPEGVPRAPSLQKKTLMILSEHYNFFFCITTLRPILVNYLFTFPKNFGPLECFPPGPFSFNPPLVTILLVWNLFKEYLPTPTLEHINMEEACNRQKCRRW